MFLCEVDVLLLIFLHAESVLLPAWSHMLTSLDVDEELKSVRVQQLQFNRTNQQCNNRFKCNEELKKAHKMSTKHQQ